MIEVTGLTKLYGNKRAIDAVNFSVKEGEIIGLLGLNGAGKSTILKVLASYLSPTNGDVSIGGHNLKDSADQIRKICGYLPDRPPLYNEMTVESYLEFVCQIKGVASSEIQAKISQVIKQTNLEEVRHQLLQSISHGFKQRVGIAQAIVHEPKVIILDEPINGLDPVQIIEMRDLILSLKGRYTVILSSHILSEMTKTCDRILIIDRGRLVAEGSEETLLKSLGSQMSISIRAKGSSEGLVEKVNSLEGISSVEIEADGDEVLLEVKVTRDLRGDLARRVIEQGMELLELQKSSSGLEGLFLEIINQEDPRV